MEVFELRVKEHHVLLKKRAHAMAAEHMPPIGQAALWWGDAIHHVPRSGRTVAKQLARLCGDDSRVTLPWRSLADAVGTPDKSGRLMAYTQRGVAALVEAGWLQVETVGRGRSAKTTFYLRAGERDPWLRVDDAADDLLEEVA